MIDLQAVAAAETMTNLLELGGVKDWQKQPE
jgi:hypothetical protein